MASNEDPLSGLEQIPDSIVDLTSPLTTVDETSKDRVIVQEELEKRLKQRVGRQDLVERNILPPLSLPTASKLFTNTQQLQRAKIADNLQKKMRNRPGRDNLLQMNILPDLQVNVDPALQAKQLQLRKIKLADVLNDKLAHRPGPLQLLQNGIIEPQLSQVVKDCELDDSSPPNESPTTSVGGNSRELPGISLQSAATGSSFTRQFGGRHSIAGSSPSTDLVMDTSPSSLEGSRAHHHPFGADGRKFSDSSISPAPSPHSMDETKSPDKSPRGFTSSYPPPMFKPILSPGKITTNKTAPSPGTIRKKQQKKYRKLRYHEYIPPSKSTPKGGKTNPKPPSNESPYSSLLLQQQLFLQFQVLQKQYPNGVLMQKIPEMINSLSKEQKSLAVAASKGKIPSGAIVDPSLSKQLNQPQVVPVEIPNKYNTSSVRFEDLKVSDLKAACKELGMIISGKKVELVDRLMDHNKGLLPAMALPENLMKDPRRQVFSFGQCSLDSQVSNSTTSPNSPTSSPIFQFPGDRALEGIDAGMSGSGKATAQLAELHKEFNELFERQKRNYICQKNVSAEKSLAPRPQFSELLNFKLPTTSAGPSPPPPCSSLASLQLDQQQRMNGNSLPRNRVLMNSVAGEGRASGSAAEKLSRSLPSSPKPGSPQQQQQQQQAGGGSQNSDMMDSSCSAVAAADHLEKKCNQSVSVASVLTSSSQISTSSSGPSSAMDSSASTSTNGGSVVTFSNDLEHLRNTGGGRMTFATFYQQQQQQQQHQHPSANRPGRASMPAAPSLHNATHPTIGPPSYNSVMRSRSIAGMQPGLTSLAGPLTMNNGLSYGTDMRGVSTPPNELASKPIHQDIYNPTDSMDVAMDTGEISDIFDDILKAEGEGFNHASMPILMGGSTHSHLNNTHSSLPHTSSQYSSSPSKLNPGLHQQCHDLATSISPSSSMTHQASNPMLSTYMPSLSAHQKSGSDICLNLPEGREGQKDSMDGAAPPYSNFNMGNDLNWLNLDNTAGMNYSPTFNHSFGSLSNSHSNPGSLPHEQFQHAFLDETMSTQLGGMMAMGQMAKNSNPSLNGLGVSQCGGAGDLSFLDAGLMPPHSNSLYHTTEEENLQHELGLST